MAGQNDKDAIIFINNQNSESLKKIVSIRFEIFHIFYIGQMSGISCSANP